MSEIQDRKRERDRQRQRERRALLTEEERSDERNRNKQVQRRRRLDPNIRAEEQARATARRAIIRSNSNVRELEQRADTARRKVRRLDPIVREQEQQVDTTRRAAKRLNSNVREQEQEINTTRRKVRRLDPIVREQEQQVNTTRRAAKRLNSNDREQEQEINTTRRKLRRLDPIVREQEQQVNTTRRAATRLNSNVRKQEQEINTTRRKLRRLDPIVREQEQQVNTTRRAATRLNSNVRKQEQEINTTRRKLRRLDPIVREQEQQVNTTRRAATRLNSNVREHEQQVNTENKQRRRLAEEKTDDERKRIKNEYVEKFRSAPDKRIATNEMRRSKYQKRSDLSPDSIKILRARDRQLSYQKMRNSYNEAVKEGPSHVCICCGGLWFLKNLTNINRDTLLQKQSQQFCDKVFYLKDKFPNENPEDQNYSFCATCHRNIVVDKKIPTLCLANGLMFTEIPEVLKNMTVVEERLVAPYLPFLRICGLGFERQYGLKGQVVNIPIDIDTAVTQLPRNVNQTQTVQLHLKRKMSYNHDYVCETIRPKVIWNAAKHLLSTDLYKDMGITLSTDWENSMDTEGEVPFIADPNSYPEECELVNELFVRQQEDADVVEMLSNVNVEIMEENLITSVSEGAEVDLSILASNEEYANAEILEENLIDADNDGLIEIEFAADDIVDPLNPGGDETLLKELGDNNAQTELDEENVDVDQNLFQHITMAPGEGKTPISITTENLEELAFPTIYGGTKRNITVDLSYNKLMKSELRRYDRRCSRRPDKMFFSHKKNEFISLQGALNTFLKKRKGTINLSAADVLNEEVVNQVLSRDDGYRILKNIRSSPAHWQAEEKKCLAMIRQYGIPTLFITLSAAETKWPELLVILAKVVDGKTITLEEAKEMEFNEKSRLIRADPITCARYFDHRFKTLHNLWTNESSDIFDEHYVINYYIRIEFQHRGSPHVHGLYWLKDAPVFKVDDPSSYQRVCDFIDKLISCDSESYPELAEFVPYQKHVHRAYCKRTYKGRSYCRFGMPMPPMSSTKILLPLEDPHDDDVKKLEVEQAKKNYKTIFNFLNAKEINTELSYEEFLVEIGMNEELYMLALRSNIEKPTIYLKRSLKDGLVNPFNPTVLGLHRANMDIQFILDPYSCCSYIINYINKSTSGMSKLIRDTIDEVNDKNFTVREKLRYVVNKFMNASEVSAQECAYLTLGISMSECGTVVKYIPSACPEERERMLKSKEELSELPSESKNIYKSNILDHYANRPCEMENECLAFVAANYEFSSKTPKITKVNPRILQLKNNSGFLRRRSKECCIRYRRYNLHGSDDERVNYYGEQIRLFLPWRNEDNDIINQNCEKVYVDNIDQIKENRLRYNKFEDDNELDAAYEEATKNSYHTNVNEVLDSDELPVLSVQDTFEADILLNEEPLTLNKTRNKNDESDDHDTRSITTPDVINEDDYLELIRSLNHKQRLFLTHLMYEVKAGKRFYHFVTGGAGVGKSRLIQAIYQSVAKYYKSLPGTDETMKVVIGAPTGKAAFVVSGSTLHSLFSLPLVHDKNKPLLPLNSSLLNTLSVLYQNLKILIIDECSMVGARMLQNVDSRLKQIFKSKLPFGGVSVILLGHLLQLKPVLDSWIFEPVDRQSYNVIAGNYLWNLFDFYELTEIMRQQNDKAFADALNRLSTGQLTEADIEMFRSRIVDEKQVPEDCLRLFYTNQKVDEYNERKINSIIGDELLSLAKDRARTEVVNSTDTNRILQAVSKLPVKQTNCLPYSLRLKASAKYMMTVNIDTNDGLTNGANCVLKSIDANETSVNTLWMQFFEPLVGKKLREARPHPTDSSLTPVTRTRRSFPYKSRKSAILIDREQFPVTLAESATIHKCQGSTYPKATICPEKSMLRAALYVACSRVTTLDGLYIIGDFYPPKPLEVNSPVAREIRRLEENKRLICKFDDLYCNNPAVERIMFHNVQSLKKHFPLIQVDPAYTNSIILFFAETMTKDNDNGKFLLKNYSAIAQLNNDDHSRKNLAGKGMWCFVKESVKDKVKLIQASYFYEPNGTKEQYIMIITLIWIDVKIISIYKSNTCSESTMVSCLDGAIDTNSNEKVVVMGDFNVDLKQKPNNTITQFLNGKGIRSVMENQSTTSQRTQIDWVYSNIDGFTCGTYETMFSYHKPVYIQTSNENIIKA